MLAIDYESKKNAFRFSFIASVRNYIIVQYILRQNENKLRWISVERSVSHMFLFLQIN